MGLAIGVRLRCALLVGVLATTVAAQQETAPDAAPASALTIAKLYVRSAELPDGCRFAVGMHFAEARKRKEFQALLR